jgi:hypothetical protein
MGKKNLFLTVLIISLLWLNIFIQPARGESSFQKGICYVTWQKDRYLSPYSDKSIKMLAQTGAEWVQIVTTYYQDKFNSREIFPTQNTPSDESIIHVIKQAHQLGLKVMLKPHIDLLDKSDGLYRGDIGSQNKADWQAWFSQYLKLVLHYAELAEKTGAELFCIGTELSFASGQTEFWRNYIIPAVRKSYSGKLIYAANWDEYKNVSFWSELDYVGIDAYFSLTQKQNPEYEDIEAGWKKWTDEIERWQKNTGKPIVFTEIGYRSCESAAAKPWDYALAQPVDLRLQSDCYKAALKVLANRTWCSGFYWWYWGSSPFTGGLNNADFTPQGKPTEIILSYFYKGPIFAQLKNNR